MDSQVRVRVIPNASRDEISGMLEEILKVKLQAVAEGGRANRSLCAFLAAEAGCGKREVRLLKGGKSREKLLSLPEKAARNLLLKAQTGAFQVSGLE